MKDRFLGMYDRLNTEPLLVPITMEALVTLVMKQNYGTQRFLSELVRQRDVEQAARVQKYLDRGDDDIAAAVQREDDDHVLLTNAIRNALQLGGY